jgi:HEAT repeat protein
MVLYCMGLWEGFRVQKFLRALDDKDPKIRIDAVDALGEAGDVRAVEPLIRAIQKSENAGIPQARMIIALGNLQDPRATGILLKVVYGRVDTVPFSEMARIRAVESLGRIGDERAVRPLFQFMKHQRENQGTYGGQIFSGIRDALVRIARKHPHVFCEAMQDPDEYIRSETIQVLRTILEPKSVPVLIKALEDVNYVVRIQAAEALGQLGDPQAEEALRYAMKDVNRDVRSAARRALAQVEAGHRQIPEPSPLGNEGDLTPGK